MSSRQIELENLAVMFRTGNPNVYHVDSYNTIERAGLLYPYGVFRGTPPRHRRRLRAQAEALAQMLERRAREFGQ